MERARMEQRGLLGRILALSALGFCPALFALGEGFEFQVGYAYNTWSSDFIPRGSEHRIPASLRFTAEGLSLQASGSWVSGEYLRDATSTTLATAFRDGGFSDTSFSIALDLPMGGGHKSNLSGSLNLPTGDTSWEARSEGGSIPLVFEPGFYRGRGWGGSLFYSVSSVSEPLQWGLGAGYLFTTLYEMGDSGGSFNPGDSLVVMGSLGGDLSAEEKLGARLLHSFAFESKVADPSGKFTSADSTMLTGQWLKRMGGDRLALNLSYSFFSRGWVVDPFTLAQVREPQNFLGDRLEVRPTLRYQAGEGVTLETGACWKKVFPNGYSESDLSHFQGGGNLFGVEQGVTFKLGEGAFLNLAGLYHYVMNDKAAFDAADNLTGVTYHRFTVGSNVGTQW